MCHEEKKTTDELVSLYELEPELKDVYVESPQDKSLLDSFLRKCHKNKIAVYTADEFHVPDTELAARGLAINSSRSKLLWLSQALAEAPEINASVLCVADRDYEDFLPSSVEANPFLALTDYNSLESYVLDDGALSKFISIALGRPPAEYATLRRRLVKALKEIFFIRLANESLEWGMTWVKPRRYISVRRDYIEFDRDSFITAYLLRNTRGGARGEFEDMITQLKANSPADDRHLIRGHDLMEVLHYAAKKLLQSSRKVGDAEFFAGALLASLEAEDLKQFGLFQRILAM